MLNTRIRAMAAMILREMTTRYGRSAGGYVWAIIDPVAFIAIFTAIFSQITREPALGDSFPLFFATGVIAFNMYRDIADAVGGAFTYNRPLFTYPQVTVLDAVMARFVLHFLTQIVVAVIVFGALFAWNGEVPLLDVGIVMTAFALAAAIGLGVGSMNAILFVVAPTWLNIWSVISRPLFIISGVFFIPEMLPSAVRDLVLLNPLTHVIGVMRRGFYPSYDAEYVSWTLAIGFPLLTLAAGLLLTRRHQGRLIER